MTTSIADVGEFPLIDRLTADLALGPAVSVGPGDDGAVFLVDNRAVSSIDTYVEGVHFRRDWCAAGDVGRKAVAATVADIEAMGAQPVSLMVAFAAPGDLPADWALELAAGLKEECAKARINLVGGDVSSARDITLSLAAIGELGGREPVLRSGARPGDVLALRGRLGWAAAGLAALRRGFRSPRAVVKAYQCPLPPYGAGAEAAIFGASAMIDISDGLLADLGHIAQASDVTIDLDSSRLEVAEPIQAVSQATGRPPLEFVLTGGEDHALAAAFPFGQVPGGWTVIGRVQDPAGSPPTVLVDGQFWGGPAGWTHFR
ncbi:MAG: thiamine-phosphate kinase [Propionibacteriaceae bacterium]|nr:thiamine-phosphate kinase [Propionibacteriaceae bacterium]